MRLRKFVYSKKNIDMLRYRHNRRRRKDDRIIIYLGIALFLYQLAHSLSPIGRLESFRLLVHPGLLKGAVRQLGDTREDILVSVAPFCQLCDGRCELQSGLSPKNGAYRADSITCSDLNVFAMEGLVMMDMSPSRTTGVLSTIFWLAFLASPLEAPFRTARCWSSSFSAT